MARRKMSVRKRRAHLRMRTVRFLTRVRGPVTYGDVAKELHIGSAMAIGQILKGIVNDDPKHKKLTAKVKAEASLRKTTKKAA